MLKPREIKFMQGNGGFDLVVCCFNIWVDIRLYVKE